ncbi:hypothetical protein IMSAGC011_03557 [Lachnospiraceae bacterium]|nr:hypothetical protein IMSAGC011_03557 [Lachnospiraceae bacterium]
MQKYRQLLTSLYEDYHEGLLNKDEYLDLKESYQEQVNELSEALDNMTTQQDRLTAAFKADTSHIDEFRKYMEFPVLNRKMLVSMVKKIYIYPKNHIHIVFRFPDEFEKLLHFLPETVSNKLIAREV